MYTGVVDVSHWEYDSLQGRIAAPLAAARSAGVAVVIAKATQGKDYVDPTWRKWARAIVDAGLLLGAYHFNSATSAGDNQADWFLRALEAAGVDVDRTMLCLDYERNPTDPTMTVPDARAFVHRIHARTGQRPAIYGDSSFLGNRFNLAPDVLGEFPLWVAAYGPTVPKIPKAWTGAGRHGYTLFQYTNGTQGPADQAAWPRVTVGLGRVDRSAYNGTESQLRAAWPKLA